jgi:hypothetical protein
MKTCPRINLFNFIIIFIILSLLSNKTHSCFEFHHNRLWAENFRNGKFFQIESNLNFFNFFI